jgi:hypothetical protein
MAQYTTTISNSIGLYGGGENSRFENFVLGTSRFGWNTMKFYATKFIGNGFSFADVYSKNLSITYSNSLSFAESIPHIYLTNNGWYYDIQNVTVTWIGHTAATTTWSES